MFQSRCIWEPWHGSPFLFENSFNYLGWMAARHFSSLSCSGAIAVRLFLFISEPVSQKEKNYKSCNQSFWSYVKTNPKGDQQSKRIFWDWGGTSNKSLCRRLRKTTTYEKDPTTGNPLLCMCRKHHSKELTSHQISHVDVWWRFSSAPR